MICIIVCVLWSVLLLVVEVWIQFVVLNFMYIIYVKFQLLVLKWLWLYMQVEVVFDKDVYILEEFLDEDEIIQECKVLNSWFINL